MYLQLDTEDRIWLFFDWDVEDIWAHSTFSQAVILALANPKNWILAQSQHEIIFSIILVPEFIQIASRQSCINFIWLSSTI